MTFRRKLLLVFALTVLVCVAAVAWTASALARHAFERNNEEQTSALLAQFRREFDRRGEDVVERVNAVAASEGATRLALALQAGAPDYGAYLNEAKRVAETEKLDFLEFVDGQGTIISSAQWPAKFGYKESFLSSGFAKGAFLKREDLPEGTALGVFAIKKVGGGDKRLFAIGGRKLDRDFLAGLELPSGMHVMFYETSGGSNSARLRFDSSGTPQQPRGLAELIQQVQLEKRELAALVHWSANPMDDETMDAMPLSGPDQTLLGILLVGSSRRPYVELRQQIRSEALLAGSTGMLLAIVLSLWAAAHVTRPVEHLAQAVRDVAAGNLHAEVPIRSDDEIGELADSFNRMTRELLEKQERIVQAERVAAWRELARRLAHELKNPLFPLQLTVENLVTAREQDPGMFDEIFQESSATLLAEIANLKAIISRFSEFSRMPQPQFQRVDISDLVQKAARLFQAQLREPGRPVIECKLDLADVSESTAADPELLHRVVSNLMLNAVDAMPQGGTLTIRTRYDGFRAYIEVADTGVGLTPEECERIFTPYYTSKTHGTGLGLAIVQSVVSDHGGRISVSSQSGQGTTFTVELPKNLDKVQAVEHAQNTTSSA